MSAEIIFPSEVLPEIDWENPLIPDNFSYLLGYTDGVTTPITDLLSDYQSTLVGTGTDPVLDNTIDGSSLSFTGTPKAVAIKTMGTLYEGTLIFKFKATESSQYYIFTHGDYTNNRRVYIGSAISGLIARIGSLAQFIFYNGSALNRTYTVVLTWSSVGEVTTATYRTYEDGILLQTMSPDTVTGGLGSELDLTRLGGNATAGGQGNSSIKFIHSWKRELLQEEIDSIIANPYQLFKTQETVQKEYGLQTSGVEYLTFDAVSFSDTTTYEFLIKIDDLSTNLYQGLLSDGALANYLRFSSADGKLRAATNGTAAIAWGYVFTSGVEYLIVIEATAGNLELIVDGVSQGLRTFTNSALSDVNTLLSYNVASSRHLHGICRYAKIIDHATPTNSRYWEFNQTTGDYVKDHYNGAIATLVGFPANSGYVRAWGVSEGLEFDGAQYVTIPILATSTGDWTISFDATYSDGTYIIAGFSSSSSDFIAFLTGGVLRVKGLSSVINASLGLVVGVTYSFVISKVGSNVDISTETVTVSTAGISGSLNLDLIGTWNLSNSHYQGNLRYFSVVDTNSRYYDFTAIQGNSLVVPETINGQDGTMVGFPTDGVYVPEKNKVLIGQETSRTSQVGIQAPLDSSTDTLTLTMVFGNSFADIRNAKAVSGTSVTTNIFWWGKSSLTFNNDTGVFSVDVDISSIKINGVEVATLSNPVEIYDMVADDVLEIVGAKHSSNTEIKIGISNTDNYSLMGAVYKAVSVAGSTNNFSLDFTQEAGDTILDTSGNDNHGSVVGGSLRRIYDYTGYGEIVGYQFGGSTTALLTMTGAYTGTVTYFDDTTLSISGTGNYTVDNTHVKAIKTITATDTLGSYNWDGTTGSDTKIIDTVGNNHATITNASTVKWQEIVPVDVYTIGATDKDYNTLYAFAVAKYKSGTTRKRVIIHGDVAIGADTNGRMDAADEFAQGLDVFAAIPFTDGSVTGKSTLIAETSSQRFKWGAPSSTLVIDGVVIKSDVANHSPLQFHSLRAVDVIINNSAIIGLGGTDIATHGLEVENVSSKIALTRSLISGFSASGVNRVGGELSLNDCIVRDNNTSGNANRYGIEGVVNCTNVVALDNSNGDFDANVTGSNNISEDATATTLGIGTGSVDFTGAFVDEASGDYRINQAWADTNLVSNGWNGSDIASWAYYTVVEAGNAINLLQYGSSPVIGVKYYDGATLSDVTLQLNGTIVWQV